MRILIVLALLAGCHWYYRSREHRERPDPQEVERQRHETEFDEKMRASKQRMQCRRDPALCVPSDAGIDGGE